MDNDLFGDAIHIYTRTQALADGMLINVSGVALEAGFRLPVAVTAAVWGKCISWTTSDTEKQVYQDEAGRLWDVLWMLRMAINNCKGESVVRYRLLVIPRDGRSRKPASMVLKAEIHGGVEREPVITIMLPSED
jgi:hypothetical protein